MKKLFVPVILLMGVQASAAVYKATEVKVNCTSPAMIAGAANVNLSGNLSIVVSPTTGMTKLKEGSYLTLTKSKRSGSKVLASKENILVSGTYYAASNPIKIEANQEPSRADIDDRTYSEILIDGQNSLIRELKGNKTHPLDCKITKK